MSANIYRVIDVVGSSPESTDAAIRNAIARVSETTRHVEWFEVTETRGHVVDGQVGHFQVTVRVGFRIDPADSTSD